MIKKIISAVFFLFFLSSCKEFKELECTGVTGFKMNKIDMKGLDADVILEIKNPNTIGFSIYPSEFDIKLAGIGLGKAKLRKRVHISANTTQNYSFNLKSSFKDMNLMDVMKLVNQGSAGTIHVKGNLKAGKFYIKKKFPIDVKESIR